MNRKFNQHSIILNQVTKEYNEKHRKKYTLKKDVHFVTECINLMFQELRENFDIIDSFDGINNGDFLIVVNNLGNFLTTKNSVKYYIKRLTLYMLRNGIYHKNKIQLKYLKEEDFKLLTDLGFITMEGTKIKLNKEKIKETADSNKDKTVRVTIDKYYPTLLEDIKNDNTDLDIDIEDCITHFVGE